MVFFKSLDGFEPTRKTLHLYSRAMGAIPRALGIPHPKWWHISLKLRPDGLCSDNIPLPDGGILSIKMDLRAHKIVVETSSNFRQEFDMTASMSSSEMGNKLIVLMTELGFKGEYARGKFENEEPRVYDPQLAENFFETIVEVERIFKIHQAKLAGEVSPVQLWPHGFDIAFDWFGTRIETFEKDGQTHQSPAQLNLGFYTGNESTEPYFYSNPWPFEEKTLLEKVLPKDAKWHTQDWKGSILPYAALVDDSTAEERLLAFARAVYDFAHPTLMS